MLGDVDTLGGAAAVDDAGAEEDGDAAGDAAGEVGMMSDRPLHFAGF